MSTIARAALALPLLSLAVFADVRLLRKLSPRLAATALGGCNVCLARWLALGYVAGSVALDVTLGAGVLGLRGAWGALGITLWGPIAGASLLLLEWSETLAPAVVKVPPEE